MLEGMLESLFKWFNQLAVTDKGDPRQAGHLECMLVLFLWSLLHFLSHHPSSFSALFCAHRAGPYRLDCGGSLALWLLVQNGGQRSGYFILSASSLWFLQWLYLSLVIALLRNPIFLCWETQTLYFGCFNIPDGFFSFVPYHCEYTLN